MPVEVGLEFGAIVGLNDADAEWQATEYVIDEGDGRPLIARYNTVRPHGSLGQQTPAAYAAACAGTLLVEGACSAALASSEPRTNPAGLSSSA
jgi:hypothetical protein